MAKFTPEDLVQYLYKETSVQKSAAIEAALDSDWKLREVYDQMRESQKNLESIKLTPGNEVMDRIVQHAAKNIGLPSH